MIEVYRNIIHMLVTNTNSKMEVIADESSDSILKCYLLYCKGQRKNKICILFWLLFLILLVATVAFDFLDLELFTALPSFFLGMTSISRSSGQNLNKTSARAHNHKPIERNAKAHACIVSAILGGYEKTAKGKTNITDHSMFMILDERSKESTANSSIWTPVKLNSKWWAYDCYRFEGAEQ